MSSARIEDPAEMLSKGENVYCKVISVEVGYFLKQRFPLAFFFLPISVMNNVTFLCQIAVFSCRHVLPHV